MNIRKLFTILFISLLILGVSTTINESYAAINPVINFQGKVVNNDETNVTDGSYSFVFKLYTSTASGASAIYTEDWSVAGMWQGTVSSVTDSDTIVYATDTNESTLAAGQYLTNITQGETVLIRSINTGSNILEVSDMRLTWAGSDIITNKVYVEDGVFRVGLGTKTSLSSVDFDQPLYLGVTFNGGSEMRPLIQYTASPYAFQADDASNLDGLDSTSFLRSDQSDNFTSGTLTMDDGTTLDVQGAFTFGDSGDTGSIDTSGWAISSAGAITGATYEGLTITSTTGTFTLTNGKTLAVQNSITLSGTDGDAYIFPNVSTSDTVVTLAVAQTLTNKTIGSTGLTFSGAGTDITTGTNEDFTIDPNGTGDLVFTGGGGSVAVFNFTAAPTVDMVSISNVGNGAEFSNVDGISITFEAASGGLGKSNAGARINGIASGETSDSLYGLRVETTGSAGVVAGVSISGDAATSGNATYGIDILNLTGGAGDEYALNIGTGWDRGLSVASASVFSAALTSESTLVVGSGGNTFTFNPASGPVYAGTARPAKSLVITPEYPGGTLTAYYGAGTDTNITGNMTADVETSGTSPLNRRTYYQWERTTDATQHFYTIAVRVTLPKDFDAWATSNAITVAYVTESATTTNSDLDVRVFLQSDTDTTPDAESNNNASTSWTTVSLDDSDLTEWNAADEVGIIYLRMGSASSNHVRVGDITLNYSAKF